MIIDLSKYNVVTDWKRVKKSVSGAILRCGYRGYGSGKIVEDAKFKEFAAACKQNDIPFGLYFMSQAVTAAEGAEEAEYSMAKAREYGVTLPVFIDSEDGDGTSRVVRADGLTKAQRTEVVKAFCDTVANFGFQAGVYASEDWYQEKLHYDQLKERYIMWVAKYGKNDGTKTSEIKLGVCHMHQYTSKGRVDGVKGDVDLNDGDPGSLRIEKTQDVKNESAKNAHVQMNYQPGKSYTVDAEGLRIRTKKAFQKLDVLPGGAVIGTAKKGSAVKNFATARVGDAIWMCIGSDAEGREKWICADTGEKAYVK